MVVVFVVEAGAREEEEAVEREGEEGKRGGGGVPGHLDPEAAAVKGAVERRPGDAASPHAQRYDAAEEGDEVHGPGPRSTETHHLLQDDDNGRRRREGKGKGRVQPGQEEG